MCIYLYEMFEFGITNETEYVSLYLTQIKEEKWLGNTMPQPIT